MPVQTPKEEALPVVSLTFSRVAFLLAPMEWKFPTEVLNESLSHVRSPSQVPLPKQPSPTRDCLQDPIECWAHGYVLADSNGDVVA